MESRRALGTLALTAVGLAAISFAVTDASIVAANGCVGADATCTAQAVPVVAQTFAALGALALLVGIVPTVWWIVATIERTRSEPRDHEIAASRIALARRPVGADDEL